MKLRNIEKAFSLLPVAKKQVNNKYLEYLEHEHVPGQVL